jgi:hypothetical protein
LNYGSYSRPSLNIGFDHITERFEQETVFEDHDNRTAHYEGIDLGKYLSGPNGGKRGVFRVLVKSFVPKPKAEEATETAEPEAESYSGGDEGDGDGESTRRRRGEAKTRPSTRTTTGRSRTRG